MIDGRWEIGICGTFDVPNYGDLLFPLVAERELTERLGSISLHRFSYHAKSPPAWPYEVTSVTALPEMVSRLDALLIGGGHLIRSDKQIAAHYDPPSPAIHHPSGYWLTPALIALQHNVPVIWNAPGTDGQAIAPWTHPLLATALTLSRYVAVRDEVSGTALTPLTHQPIAVVPDTAFGLPRLLSPSESPSVEFEQIRETCGLRKRYIVLQANRDLSGIVRQIKSNFHRFDGFQFLALPIGPVHGDDAALIDPDFSIVRLPRWPNPLVIAELIGRSEAVVGQSYHLCISALAQGVPAFGRHILSRAKFSALWGFDTIYDLPLGETLDLEWFLSRVGRSAPSPSVRATLPLLDRHWDQVANAVLAGPDQTSKTLDRLWQFVPALLEEAGTKKEGPPVGIEQSVENPVQGDTPEPDLGLCPILPQVHRLQERLHESIRRLTVAQAEIAVRDARLADTFGSLSWRITKPLRFLGRFLPNHRNRRLINLKQIRRHRLESVPYSWGAINHLYRPDDAARLSATYPQEYFKLVCSHDGEKEYNYESRELIGMGSHIVSHVEELSDSWRALAADLLSAEYRTAMSVLTGLDLSPAPMEVNVFHYGPGGSLGPHRDLPEKIVTHVLYFNESWNGADGGCLRILGSPDPLDVAAEIPPIIGFSSVLVRSENSWHAVSRVSETCASSRRAVTVTFYRPGSISTMWPPGDQAPLHRYGASGP